MASARQRSSMGRTNQASARFSERGPSRGPLSHRSSGSGMSASDDPLRQSALMVTSVRGARTPAWSAAKGSKSQWKEAGLGATSARLPVEASQTRAKGGTHDGSQTPVSERDLMRAGENLREWVQSARRPSTPLEIPKRIGSVGSGGVDGFGYIRSDLKVNPVKIDQPAGEPGMLDPNYRFMSPGRPWWERERFKVEHLAETPRTKGRPPSPVPFGAVLNKAVLQNDSRLSVTENFQANRKDLRGCSPRTVQRELLRTMVQNQTANEVPREVGLGPDYFYDSEDQAVNRLMAQLDSKEDGCNGDFEQFHKYLMNRDYIANAQSSQLVRKTIRPPQEWGPPPAHPDAMDGYSTARKKHREAMNRLYGPSSGRVSIIPDRPETWLRRDGIKAGVPGIQSFTFYAHELQNAGYGAP